MYNCNHFMKTSRSIQTIQSASYVVELNKHCLVQWLFIVYEYTNFIPLPVPVLSLVWWSRYLIAIPRIFACTCTNVVRCLMPFPHEQRKNAVTVNPNRLAYTSSKRKSTIFLLARRTTPSKYLSVSETFVNKITFSSNDIYISSCIFVFSACTFRHYYLLIRRSVIGIIGTV